MKNKKEKIYFINQEVLNVQMSKDDVSNWVIQEGVNQIKEGKTPGVNMMLFLQHMNIVTY
jgi:hypothetical protein